MLFQNNNYLSRFLRFQKVSAKGIQFYFEVQCLANALISDKKFKGVMVANDISKVILFANETLLFFKRFFFATNSPSLQVVGIFYLL